jgi:hypothetical protein
VCGKNLSIVSMCALSPVVHTSNISSCRKINCIQKLWTAIFWAIMQRVVIIPYLCCGRRWGPIGCPETSVRSLQTYYVIIRGPGSSVGIATAYGLDGPVIGSRWGQVFFRTRPDRPWGPPSLLYNGYRVFPGGKAARAWCWPPTASNAEVENE